MLSYEEFVDEKFASFKNSELTPTGLTTLLSLPTISGFIAYGATLGALLIEPYLHFTAISFITPVFLASLIGGTLGLIVGAMTVLYVIPSLAFMLRLLTDYLINGNLVFQYLDLCSKNHADVETKRFKEIYSFLKKLISRHILSKEFLNNFTAQEHLTEEQQNILSHIKELDESFSPEELVNREKQNKRIVDLKTQRAQEWLSSERASRYRAQYGYFDDKSDDRLLLLGMNHGYHLTDTIYYFLSLFKSSLNFRNHPSHIRSNFDALNDVKGNPLALVYSTNPIKLLLSMTKEELDTFKQQILFKDTQYRSMSVKKLSDTLALLQSKYKLTGNNHYRYDVSYCEKILATTKLWAKSTENKAGKAIENMNRSELTERRDALKQEIKFATAREQIDLEHEIGRLDMMLEELQGNFYSLF